MDSERWTVDSWATTASGGRKPPVLDSNSGPTLPARRVLVFFTIALLTLPIFAHGCHTGDHDDEPLFLPPARSQEPPP